MEQVPGDSYRAGMRASAALCVAIAPIGASFGVLAESGGWGRLAPIVMSATTFTGASQIAAVSILSAGGGAAAAIIAGLLLAARYVPIGVSVAPAFRGNVFRRFMHAQLILDESWAVAVLPGGTVRPKRLVGAGFALYLTWIASVTAGVFGGEVLGDPADFGLDAAFPALFLALLAPQLRTRRSAIAALAGAAIALALIPVAQPGLPIVAATLGCLAGWGSRAVDHSIESMP